MTTISLFQMYSNLNISVKLSNFLTIIYASSTQESSNPNWTIHVSNSAVLFVGQDIVKDPVEA